MLYFFRTGGVFMWPLLILAIVNAILVIRHALALFARRPDDPRHLAQGIHAILFWGGIGALLGILGQLSGIYNALNAIIRADAISANIVATGLAESLTTTIAGLAILFFSAIAWFALLARLRKLAEG